MVRASTLLTAAVAAGVASAQGLNIPGISAQCSSGVVGLVIGPLQCLKLTGLVPILSGSGSIIPGLDTYLKDLCPAGPVCTPDNLKSAGTTIDANCAADASAQGTGNILLNVVDNVLDHYPEFFAAVCSKNTTTGNYCVTETLQTIQDETSNNVTLEYLGGLISGNSTTLGTLTPLATSGKLCTGCLGTLYYELNKANSSLISSSGAQGVKTQCGADFGSNVGSNVAVGGNNASASASSSSAVASASASSKPSGAAGASLTPLVIAGVSVLSVVVGAAAVL